MLREDAPRLSQRDLKEYLDMATKPCHGKCWDGWYHIAYLKNSDATYEVYRFPCACTYPSGLYYHQLAQDHRYNRKADYTGHWKGHVLMHPKNLNLTKLFATLMEKVKADEVPF